jgi:hypothetical protein
MPTFTSAKDLIEEVTTKNLRTEINLDLINIYDQSDKKSHIESLADFLKGYKGKLLSMHFSNNSFTDPAEVTTLIDAMRKNPNIIISFDKNYLNDDTNKTINKLIIQNDTLSTGMYTAITNGFIDAIINKKDDESLPYLAKDVVGHIASFVGKIETFKTKLVCKDVKERSASWEKDYLNNQKTRKSITKE